LRIASDRAVWARIRPEKAQWSAYGSDAGTKFGGKPDSIQGRGETTVPRHSDAVPGSGRLVGFTGQYVPGAVARPIESDRERRMRVGGDIFSNPKGAVTNS
jgi:hypothetical protein